MGLRNGGSIKRNQQISKFNYGPRKEYNIKKVILKKCLLYDISRQSNTETIHIITNLESCYNRQLSEIASIVEESIRIDRLGIKLIAKILPRFEHHICTSFGISEQCYGRKIKRLGGIGQGNQFSGNYSRDSLYLIIRSIEQEKLGAMIRVLISRVTIQ